MGFGNNALQLLQGFRLVEASGADLVGVGPVHKMASFHARPFPWLCCTSGPPHCCQYPNAENTCGKAGTLSQEMSSQELLVCLSLMHDLEAIAEQF